MANVEDPRLADAWEKEAKRRQTRSRKSATAKKGAAKKGTPKKGTPKKGAPKKTPNLISSLRKYGISMDTLRDLIKGGRKITRLGLIRLGLPGALAATLSYAPEIRALNEQIGGGKGPAHSGGQMGRNRPKTAATRNSNVDTTDDARAARTETAKTESAVSTSAPNKPAEPKSESATSKRQRVGVGDSKTVKVGDRELANVSAEQLDAVRKASGKKVSLTDYMNMWNKTGSRPTASDFKDKEPAASVPKKMMRGGLVRKGKTDYRKGGMVYK